MHVTITVKMDTQSQAEAASCMQHFAQLRLEEVFGPPSEITMRYLVTGGKTGESIPIKLTEEDTDTAADIHADIRADLEQQEE